MKKQRTRRDHIVDQVKAARKQSREEEIKLHGKLITYTKVVKSKKLYDRKRFSKGEPLLFLQKIA